MAVSVILGRTRVCLAENARTRAVELGTEAALKPDTAFGAVTWAALSKTPYRMVQPLSLRKNEGYGTKRAIAIGTVTSARARGVTPLPTDHRPGRHVDPAWLTVSQLRRRWQLGRKTIYKFIRARDLPAWKVGSHLYRIAIEDVLRFETQNRLQPK